MPCAPSMRPLQVSNARPLSCVVGTHDAGAHPHAACMSCSHHRTHMVRPQARLSCELMLLRQPLTSRG